MGKEIERKFLVDRSAWTPRDEGKRFRQGYLSSQHERVVRVRIEGEVARLTIKGMASGVTRPEFEYDIPIEDAAFLLENLCEQPLIDKHRHAEVHFGKRWEIDVFHGLNDSLVVAEIELASEDEPFVHPPWLLEEVSGDPRYFNSNLHLNPYRRWRPA